MALKLLLKISFLIFVTMMATSCASTKKYGDRGHSYSKSRTSRSNYQTTQGKEDEYLATIETKNDKKSPYKPAKKKSFVKKPIQNDDAETAFREGIYETASQYLGLKYRSGGKSPSTGFDCSGFVAYVMAQSDLKIGGSSISMSKLGLAKEKENLQTGDLVFFGRNGNIHHVGIVSNNIDGEIEMIHSASSTGITVEIMDRSDYWRRKFMFGRDIISPFLEKPISPQK